MPKKSRSTLASKTKNAFRNRLRRQNETAEQREERLAKDRIRKVLRRQRETTVERELRLMRDRERSRRSRKFSKRCSMNTTTDMCSNKVDFDRNDDCSVEYKYDIIECKYEPDDSLGTINVACENCSALLWKGESNDLCCLQGQIKLEDIDPPSELQQSLQISVCKVEAEH